jgi:cysteine-rich repeat protein
VSNTAMVRANGGSGGGRGGAITIGVDQGPALIEGPLLAVGGGSGGPGGDIGVDADSRIAVQAMIDAHGSGAGGQIGLSSTGAVDVRSSLLASSTGAGGGSIEVVSQGDVLIASTWASDGVATPGGQIDVTGCMVTVCGLDSPACSGGGTGTLSSQGPAGLNRITGRDSTGVFGTMRATGAGGSNQLVYGPHTPVPIVLGQTTPAAALVLDASVNPCPACGNGVIDPPETCDDGNQLDGDGCSSTCQVEAPILGDANGDFNLSPEDVRFLVSELFDGDGDSIGTVSGGAVQGAPGADANQDGHVTAADLTEIERLLENP